MVLLSNKHNFLFIKTMKTAGTSIEGILEKYCMPETSDPRTHHREALHSDEGIVGPRSRPISKHGWREHMAAYQMKNKLGDKFDSLYKFTVVRNPWDKMVSMYFYKLYKNEKNQRILTFDQFISTQSHSLDHWIYHIDQKQVCNYHIRFENLNEDLKKVADILKLPDFNIADLPNWKSDTSRDKNIHYSQYYTPESQATVARLYAREIKEFGYTFESHVKYQIAKIEDKLKKNKN